MQGLIMGIILGGVLSLHVLGIALIYGITGVPNFSIGVFGLLGGFITWYFLPYNWIVAILIAIGICFALGYIMQYFLLSPLAKKRGNDLNLFFIVTISLGLIVTGLIRTIFPRIHISLHLPTIGIYTIAGIRLGGLRLFALVFSILILVALRLLQKYTNIGKAWSAISQNLRLSLLIGINERLFFALASAIGFSLACMGAIIWGALYDLHLMSGWEFTCLGYIIAVVGGIGNIWGGMIAAIIMGIIMGVSGYFLGGVWQSIILYGIVMIILIVSPRGIMGYEKAI